MSDSKVWQTDFVHRRRSSSIWSIKERHREGTRMVQEDSGSDPDSESRKQEWGNHSGKPSDSDCLDRPADKGHSMRRLAPTIGTCRPAAGRSAPTLGIGVCLHYTRTLWRGTLICATRLPTSRITLATRPLLKTAGCM